MDDRLYRAVDFVLNHAEDRDIEVILEAIKKRYEAGKGRKGLSPNVEGIARETARQVGDRLLLSRDQIRRSVQELASDILRKSAPELTEEQLATLLDAWVPSDGSAPPTDPLPGDAMAVMVDQFLRYSTGGMSATEQVRLEQEIPSWPTRYWERFPNALRQIISLYLKNAITEEEFHQGLKECIEEAPA